MNVLIVNHYVENQNEILPDVVKEIKSLVGGFRVRLVHDTPPRLKHYLWTLGKPTAVISFRPLKHFLPDWAAVYQPKDMDKEEELRCLEAAGIPVPKWIGLGKDENPDLSGFGDYVVVKPSRGARGAWVKIMRRSRVKWRPVEVRDRGVSPKLIVQEYINTGERPVVCRVGTIFGEPIYQLRYLGVPHTQEGATFQGFGGKSIVATGKGCSIDGEVPEEARELAKRTHEAFPDVPLLGTDMIQDEKTGKFYVLETNPVGGTFNLTADPAKRIREEFGLDTRDQFGGARAVARGIVQRFVSPHTSRSLRDDERANDGGLLKRIWSCLQEFGFRETVSRVLHRLRVLSVHHPLDIYIRDLNSLTGTDRNGHCETTHTHHRHCETTPKVSRSNPRRLLRPAKAGLAMTEEHRLRLPNGTEISVREVLEPELDELPLAEGLQAKEWMRQQFGRGSRLFAGFAGNQAVMTTWINSRAADLDYIRIPSAAVAEAAVYSHGSLTSSKWRNQGIGHFVKQYVLHQLKEEGVRYAVLATYLDNPGAGRWHRANGYEYWGRITYQKRGAREMRWSRLTKTGKKHLNIIPSLRDGAQSESKQSAQIASSRQGGTRNDSSRPSLRDGAQNESKQSTQIASSDKFGATPRNDESVSPRHDESALPRNDKKTSGYALTYPQLMNQAREQGYLPAELARLRRAYQKAEELFDGYYRGQRVPLICHLVRTASIVMAEKQPMDRVIAALFHSTYMLAQFEDGVCGKATPAHRLEVKQVIGEKAEELVFAYQGFHFDESATEIETNRELLILRIANELEDFLDLGLAYRGSFDYRERIEGMGKHCVQLADRLGMTALQQEFLKAFESYQNNGLSEDLKWNCKYSYEHPERQWQKKRTREKVTAAVKKKMESLVLWKK